MITNRLLVAMLIVSCAAMAACEDEPEPMPVAPAPVPEPEPEPEPAPQAEFPVEPNALAKVAALTRIPAKATFIGATLNPKATFELLGAEDPGPAEDYGPGHQPELLDIAPGRLTGAGLDPEKPVGIVMFGKVKKLTDSARWAIFATIGDEEKFREVFGLQSRDETTQTYKPTDIDDQRFFQAIRDEIIIFNRAQPVDQQSSIANDDEFAELAATLDYGSLFTGLVADKRGMSLFGAGVDADGFGVKALASSDVWAATVRIKGFVYMAGVYPELPYKQRVINKQAELIPQGSLIRNQLDEAERAAMKRRVKAAKAVPTQLQEIASLDGEQGSLKVAGRRWSGSPADVPDAYKAWVALDYTEEELAKIEELETALETLEVLDGMDPKEMVSDIDPTNMQGTGMQQTLMKMGGNFMGGDRKRGKKGDSDGGPLGMLGKVGNLGGMLGGGRGDSGPDLKVRSSDKQLQRWANRGLTKVMLCLAQSQSRGGGSARANFVLKPDGSFKLAGVSGKEPALKKCVRDFSSSGGKVQPREIPVPEDKLLPDGSAPEGYVPTSKEWVRWTFSMG